MSEKSVMPKETPAGEKMAAVNASLKRQFDDAMQEARTLRDEIRVKIHLAEMDAQTAWKKMEPNFYEAERLGAEVSEAAKTAATSVAKSFRDFRDSIRRNAATKH